MGLRGDADDRGLVTVLAISPDGRAVAGATWIDFGVALGGVSVFHEATSRARRIRSLAFSPDGAWLTVGRNDGDLELRRMPDLELVETLRGHGGAVTAVAFDPSGRTLASGADDGTTVLWDVGLSAGLVSNEPSTRGADNAE